MKLIKKAKLKLNVFAQIRYTKLGNNSQTGFTFVEMLVVISIIGFMSSIVFTGFTGVRESAYEARLNTEFRTMKLALNQYLADYGDFPADVSRNIPPGIEEYLVAQGADLDGWPDGPWPGSVYDYDAYVVDGAPVYQISLRFCDISGAVCNFPKTDWAIGFDSNSSAYYCLQGACKPHPGVQPDHPGYCINCAAKP